MSGFDKLAVECAICDAEGAALLLDLAINDMGQGDKDWKLLDREPMSGYRLFLLTREQVTTLQFAGALVFKAAQDASLAFYGKEFMDDPEAKP